MPVTGPPPGSQARLGQLRRRRAGDHHDPGPGCHRPGRPAGEAHPGHDLPAGPASRSYPRTGTGSQDHPLARPDRAIRSWPLLILDLPAAVAVWSGWVGIGQLTGFGQIHPLPGIWNSLHLDTAITMPVGVEAYAAYALRPAAGLTAAALAGHSPARVRGSRRACRALRTAGMHGSNADLGALARMITTKTETAPAPWDGAKYQPAPPDRTAIAER